MKFKEALLHEHSKAQTLKIVAEIGSSRKRFADLMAIIFANESIVAARAAWVLSHAGEAHPKLVEPYITQMLENLRRPVHDAVKRNSLKLIQAATLTEEQMGLAADLCFAFLADLKQPAAIRAYSLTICLRICRHEPALASELKLILDNCYRHSPPAVQSRAKHIRKELDQLIEKAATNDAV